MELGFAGTGERVGDKVEEPSREKQNHGKKSLRRK